MSKLIPLTKGYSAIVDDEDYDRIVQHNWQIATGKTIGGVYAKRTVGRKGNRKTVLMHREVLQLQSPPPFVDHINYDGLDNRKSNLRLCTLSENSVHRRLKSNPSGFRGVTFYKRDKKWCAQIRFKNRCVNLGYFRTPQEAAIAYDTAALMLFGEFAVINGV